MPDLWRRIESDVEAMPLVSPRDMHVAEQWLRGHDLPSAHRHPTLTGRGLLVPAGPAGAFVIARLGQWLTRDLTCGDFQVVDHDVFTALHRRSDLTAVVDAVQ